MQGFITNQTIQPTTIAPRSLIEVHCADIHFGNSTTPVDKHYQIMEEQFLQVIEPIPFNLLTIAGDLFDHKVMANSPTAMYASIFVDRCVDQCRRKGATLLLLLGTEKHDADQFKLFYHYLDDPTVDVRIVEHACFQYINDQMILCLPEEYYKGREYYEKLLFHTCFYNEVIMHGTIAGAVHGADKRDLDGERAIFDLSDFRYCSGPIISGHVHTAKCLQTYIYYTGCPVRYHYGEEEPKGFTILVRDTSTGAFMTHFQEIQSFRYDTVNLDLLLSSDPKTITDHINNLKAQGIDNLRVQFTVDSPIVPIIKQYYRSTKNIKIDDDGIRKAKVEALNLKQDAERLESSELSFILDESLNPFDKFVRFVNYNEQCEFITVDELKQLLTEDI